MSKKPTIKGEIVIEALRLYPHLKDHTISKLLHKKYPEHFPDNEDARCRVRYYRGHSGEYNRKNKTTKEFQTPLNYDYNSFKSPPSKADGLQKWSLPLDRKNILFVSDIHLPYHDERALDGAMNYGIKNNVDTIWFNGDFLDMYQASSHEKRPGKDSIAKEFEFGRNFLKQVRDTFSKANIYYLEGNHETRWYRYLSRTGVAELLLGDSAFELPTILKLAEKGVHWIDNGTLINFGKLYVIHGNEFPGGGGVFAARQLALKSKDNIIAGDKHKTQFEPFKSLGGRYCGAWSVGCLCDLNPEYLKFAHTTWNHGFAHIEIDGDLFHVENKRIEDGKII